ncbi:MAG: GNAT family N-acetyltransferase [Roseiflexaceae bacterium]
MTTLMIDQLTSRFYQGEADHQSIVDLTNLCDVQDQLDEGTTVTELIDDISEPGIDPFHDLRLWHTADGTLVAYAEFLAPLNREAAAGHPATFTWFKIHPDWRNADLYDQVIAWAVERTRAKAAEWGLELTLEATARDRERARQEQLSRLGFAPLRYFLRMERPITGELLDPVWPEGISVHEQMTDQEYVDLHNTVWVDHFGYEPWTPEIVAHYRQAYYYDAELDLYAKGADGTLAAFCWCSIRELENQRTGRNDGWIGLLGVRREFRSLGLGRALLREGMRRLRAKGAEYARLGVDGASPTGATKLYESEGFQTTYTRILFSRTVTTME